MNLELGNMSNWVKGENTAVVRFCFFGLNLSQKAKISNRERKENETKRANVKQNVKCI